MHDIISNYINVENITNTGRKDAIRTVVMGGGVTLVGYRGGLMTILVTTEGGSVAVSTCWGAIEGTASSIASGEPTRFEGTQKFVNLHDACKRVAEYLREEAELESMCAVSNDGAELALNWA